MDRGFDWRTPLRRWQILSNGDSQSARPGIALSHQSAQVVPSPKQDVNYPLSPRGVPRTHPVRPTAILSRTEHAANANPWGLWKAREVQLRLFSLRPPPYPDFRGSDATGTAARALAVLACSRQSIRARGARVQSRSLTRKLHSPRRWHSNIAIGQLLPHDDGGGGGCLRVPLQRRSTFSTPQRATAARGAVVRTWKIEYRKLSAAGLLAGVGIFWWVERRAIAFVPQSHFKLRSQIIHDRVCCVSRLARGIFWYLCKNA
jgi:hypothetical protein